MEIYININGDEMIIKEGDKIKDIARYKKREYTNIQPDINENYNEIYTVKKDTNNNLIISLNGKNVKIRDLATVREIKRTGKKYMYVYPLLNQFMVIL